MQLATLLLRAATLGPPLAAAYSIAKRQTSPGASPDDSLSSCSQNGDVLPLAGASLFFDSANISNACHAAHVTHLDVAGIDYDAKVQGEGSDCQGRRVGSITLPPDMSGRLRVDWLCSDDKLRPCTVYSVLNPFPLQTPPSGSKVVIDQACLAEDAVGLTASKTAASAVDSVVASTLGSSSLESSSLGWSTLGSFSQSMPDRTAMGPPATSRSALDVGAPSSTFAVAAAESLAGSSAFAVSSSRPQFTSRLTSQLMAQDTPTASTMTAPVAATDALADGEGHSSAALPTKSAEGCGLPHAGASVSAQDAPSRQCACS